MFIRLLKFAFRVTSKPRAQRPEEPTQEIFRPATLAPGARTVPQPRTKARADTPKTPEVPLETTITGKCYVIDGDTIQIGKVRLRLAGNDAPELDHPWGQKAKWDLVRICKGEIITAEIEQDISYDRLVATCYLSDGRDLSAEMVKRGLALDWPKFSGGKYAAYEPEGVRKKHWKAAARQRGQMRVFNR